jgi:DNA-nicking Smr family endonuclease
LDEQEKPAPTRIPVEDSFDLHSFLPRDVPHVLADYLEEARRKHLKEVRVIHGKGSGVRRAQVRKFLATSSVVASYFDAPPERGGLGATVVLLKS